MSYDDSSLDDYVDVAERIAKFRDKYPNGSLQPANPQQPFTVVTCPAMRKDPESKQWVRVDGTFIAYTAAAYRTPDDPRPGIACAWEPLPGGTPYTRNSELQNAETSAWGRAIQAALAADARGSIASREEVRNRQAERQEPTSQPPNARPQPQGADDGPRDDVQQQAQTMAETARRVRTMKSLKAVHDEAERRHLLDTDVAEPGTGVVTTLGRYIYDRRTELQVADVEPQQEQVPA